MIRRPVQALCIALFCLFGLEAQTQERIVDYHADIRVEQDGSLVVSEEITVQAEGINIRRGIYRDFPTDYKDRYGNNYKVRFQVLSVTRNDATEPWHSERRSNGIRIYVGDANSQLPHGTHQYKIRFRTERQLGFFEDYDELYWNVTGTGWQFPIDHASARIRLPDSVSADQWRLSFYTGAQGQSDQDATAKITGASEVFFETSRALPARHGLTVAAGWPKGMIEEPDTGDRLAWFFSDNKGALALLGGLIFALFWYLRSWNTHGRDPRKGVIIPRFKPPEGISPAASRYILDMGLHARSVTAAIISLAVKQHLRIDEKDSEFTLYRNPGTGRAMSEGESQVLLHLLPEHESWLALDNENHRVFQQARKALTEYLKQEFQGRLFKLNTRFMAPVVIISVVTVLVGLLLGAGPLAWVMFSILTLALHITFLILLRAPTATGRRVMDEIEGFKRYLDTAERDRLERMRSPALTPEVFEMFLPYAYALGVENNWCKRFENELPREVRKYQPAWHSGNAGGINSLHHMGNDLGKTFSSAISSASSPPGSSSGSGGGGFSGGGGGGGGGGGW